ncbi:MAG: hypothetical protein LAQ69_41995 [Acidobacteriia bacterium]|nr:hypothetical protein [Terriglobia bacterium]
MDSDSVTRSRQLYSLLQPYAARFQALLERLDYENPFKALAEEDQAPKEFASLARSVSELPAGEIAALLDKVIAADKSGEKNSLDLQHIQETLAKLEEQIRSVGKVTQSFAKKRVRVPAPLSPDLQGALRVEAARLERDITAVRARMIKEHDLRILREAKVPADTIAAIVRDAPKQKDVDNLTGQLEKIRRLLTDSAVAAKLAERRNSLDAFTSAARESLHPILDPRVMHQLSEFAQPIFKSDNRSRRRE